MSEPVVYMLQDEDDVEFNTMNMFSCGRTGGIPLYLTPDPRVAELEAVLRECRDALSDECQVSAVHHTNGEVTVVAADTSPNSKRLVAKIDEVLK